MPRIQGWHTGAGESSVPGRGWSSQTVKKGENDKSTLPPQSKGNVTGCCHKQERAEKSLELRIWIFAVTTQCPHDRLKLTWFGMSRLLLGNLTQFLHILLTRSSLMMTISWLQYWILTGKKTGPVTFSIYKQKNCKSMSLLTDVHYIPSNHISGQRQQNLTLSMCLMCYLHGFVVKTENGTLCLNSSVMWSAKGGLRKT